MGSRRDRKNKRRVAQIETRLKNSKRKARARARRAAKAAA